MFVDKPYCRNDFLGQTYMNPALYEFGFQKCDDIELPKLFLKNLVVLRSRWRVWVKSDGEAHQILRLLPKIECASVCRRFFIVVNAQRACRYELTSGHTTGLAF